MTEPKRAVARPKAAEPTPLLASLPALSRLLDAAAAYLEGINEARAREQALEDEANATMQELVQRSPDYSRERENEVMERALGPVSLVGSWFHKFEKGKVAWQGSVVAEPQAGCYLCELHNWLDGSSAHQRMFTLLQMTSQEPGDEFRFYDSPEWMREATSQKPAYDYVERGEEPEPA